MNYLQKAAIKTIFEGRHTVGDVYRHHDDKVAAEAEALFGKYYLSGNFSLVYNAATDSIEFMLDGREAFSADGNVAAYIELGKGGKVTRKWSEFY